MVVLLVLRIPGQLEPWLWTAETWAGWTFIALVAAAVVAWRQLSEAKDQLSEAKELREATLRPFVILDFEVESGEV